MDPIVMSLLIAFFLTKNVTQDLVYKTTGKLPPSYLRDEARRKAREERRARREAKGDGPIKRFLANELEQALADATEKRDRARAKKRAERRKQWAAEDAAEAAAAEDASREENQRRPDPVEEPVPAPEWVPCSSCDRKLVGDQTAGYDAAGGPLCSGCRTGRPPESIDQEQRDPDAAVEAVEMLWPCRRCGRELRNAGVDGYVLGTPLCRTCQDADTPPPPGPDQAPQPAPSPQDTPDPRQPDPAPADVIDINTWRPRAAMPEPIKEADMSGETPNLSAALTYTNDMSTQCAAGAASVETSIASLRAGGVSGPSIDALVQAQEALRMAMEKFNSAHAELTRHITVKEAYTANADAGDKQFVTQD